MAGTDYRATHEFKRLQRYLAAEEPSISGWWDAFCPLHDDSTRSAGFNFKIGRWSCRVKCGSGSIGELVARLDAQDDFDAEIRQREEWIEPDPEEADNVVGISDRKAKRRQGRPMPSEDVIASWAERLRSDPLKVEAFTRRRGLSEETLADHEIGWSDDDRAFTVPVRSAAGPLLNVRLYRIGAQSTKIWSYGSPGMDASALYPERVLTDNSTIVIAEGEWDALMLNEHGIPAVSGTTGARQWMAKWDRKFKGKNVYICYDRDTAGVDGAEKVARSLSGTARAVYIINLPLPFTDKSGADVTDYFRAGHSPDEFRILMKEADVFAAPLDGAPVEVSVRESFNPGLAGTPMSMTVAIVGKHGGQHIVPKSVTFSCAMNADDKCTGCPMKDAGGKIEADVPSSDSVVLRLRDVNDEARDEALRKWIGAHKCGRMKTFIKTVQPIELLNCRTALDYNSDTEGDNSARPVINVGQYATEANRTVKIIGTTYADPNSQSSVFQAWGMEAVESTLDTYTLDGEDVRLMSIFKPAKGQKPLTKMKLVALDLADNVTGIIGRNELHMAMDLVWHSVVSFVFAGSVIERGWCELLVIGDARTGKSKVADKMSRHYGVGRMVSCESASIPGLLGAVKQLPGGKGWMLEWGAIPLNDRRLVIMDEAGGLNTEQIGQLSSVRSSGRAEIIKAETHITWARTRLIWLANPRNNIAGMAGYMYGIRSIQPLIGNMEDIARFDLAMTVSEGDVPLADINRRADPRPHVYSSAASHALLRWVWSRKREDIEFTRSAEDAVFKASRELGNEYVSDPPLIQGQNVREKIARIAVAIAARTFSTDRTHTKIVVEPIHVESAVTFINHIYGNPDFGYREVSRRFKAEQADAVSKMDDVKEYLYTRPGLARFLISSGGEFRSQQLQEQLNYTREEANLVIQRLSSMSMLRSSDQWSYRITPYLNIILREIK
jgi:hypothetical protein